MEHIDLREVDALGEFNGAMRACEAAKAAHDFAGAYGAALEGWTATSKFNSLRGARDAAQEAMRWNHTAFMHGFGLVNPPANQPSTARTGLKAWDIEPEDLRKALTQRPGHWKLVKEAGELRELDGTGGIETEVYGRLEKDQYGRLIVRNETSGKGTLLFLNMDPKIAETDLGKVIHVQGPMVGFLNDTHGGAMDVFIYDTPDKLANVVNPERLGMRILDARAERIVRDAQAQLA